jgi:hypothetical protein
MSPYTLQAVAAAWAASIAGAGYWAYGAGQDNVTAFNAKAAEIVQTTREAGQQGAAAAIAQNRPKNTTIVNEVQHEIRTNTVYATCKHSDAGLRGVNEALRASGPSPLVVASCPELTPLGDDTFGATTSKLVEVANYYRDCREAALAK